MKSCSKCKQSKEFHEFYKRNRGTLLGSHCKECVKQQRKDNYAKTGYVKTNWEITKRKQHETEKLKVDLSFKLKKYLRNRLRSALKKEWKRGSSVRDLGCSIEKFKLWLEMHFKEGMTWTNQGAWHLDHILPLSHFNLTDRQELLKACHFTNIQPLWAKENYSKYNKILEN